MRKIPEHDLDTFVAHLRQAEACLANAHDVFNHYELNWLKKDIQKLRKQAEDQRSSHEVSGV